MTRSHFPAKTQLSTEELRELATALNKALRSERSRISTRERERLDRIADNMQLSDGRKIHHPRHVQIVEQIGEKLFLGEVNISHAELLDRSRDNKFEYKYFDPRKLNEEISDFCFILSKFSDQEFDLNERFSEIKFAMRESEPRIISEWIVEYLSRVYNRVFKLHPYLGGAGPNEDNREPNSPFGCFAKFVLHKLDIKTRSGSNYPLWTIKNCMPAGSLRASRLPDELELSSAREALENEQSLKRSRGRPRKSKSNTPVFPAPPVNRARAGKANGTPDTN